MEGTETEKIIRMMQPRMRLFALKMLRDSMAAEDIVQNAVLSFLQACRSGKHIRNAEGFLMRSVRNGSLNYLKRHSRHLSCDISLMNNDETPVYDGITPEVTDQVKIVRRIVDGMPDKYRTVLILRDILGYEIREISDITGSTEAGVRKILSRARSGIREKLLSM